MATRFTVSFYRQPDHGLLVEQTAALPDDDQAHDAARWAAVAGHQAQVANVPRHLETALRCD